MAKRYRLNAEERNFFLLVNQAVMANPFSDERVEADLKIAGLYPDITESERLIKMTLELRKRVEKLEQAGGGDLSRFSGKDRRLMRDVFLFDFFHIFLESFDQLIVEQIQSGEIPEKVDFYKEALAVLTGRGFTHEEALHFFALCYQLRRAFFFIQQALVGRSPCMKDLRRSLWNNVFTYNLERYDTYLWNRMEDFSTLLLGETGTGKGTAANAIGRSGFIPFDERKGRFAESFTKSFVSINLSQFPESLIESELFGHKKGAFTGAVEDHKGIFNHSSPYGAIFLDEIGEVSIPVQIKLLQILEERKFCPVGSHKSFRFEGRIIGATNQPIEELLEKGAMRPDFYYRLCSDIIVVPPLRRRIKEDPGELDDLLSICVERILGFVSADLTKVVKSVINEQLGPDYPWPGNVRELGQCVRRIILNHRYKGAVQKTDSAPRKPSALAAEMENGTIDAQNLVKGYCDMLYQRFGTYGEVARRTKLDRRTVKKYIQEWEEMKAAGS